MRRSHALVFWALLALTVLAADGRANWLLVPDVETAPAAATASSPAGWLFAVAEPPEATAAPAPVEVRTVTRVVTPEVLPVVRSSPATCGPSGCRVQYRVVRSR